MNLLQGILNEKTKVLQWVKLWSGAGGKVLDGGGGGGGSAEVARGRPKNWPKTCDRVGCMVLRPKLLVSEGISYSGAVA